MNLDEFWRTLTIKSDTDGHAHVVAREGLPSGLQARVRAKGEDDNGEPADDSPEYFPALQGRYNCWWIADDQELVFQLGGQRRVWPRDNGPGESSGLTWARAWADFGRRLLTLVQAMHDPQDRVLITVAEWLPPARSEFYVEAGWLRVDIRGETYQDELGAGHYLVIRAIEAVRSTDEGLLSPLHLTVSVLGPCASFAEDAGMLSPPAEPPREV